MSKQYCVDCGSELTEAESREADALAEAALKLARQFVADGVLDMTAEFPRSSIENIFLNLGYAFVDAGTDVLAGGLGYNCIEKTSLDKLRPIKNDVIVRIQARLD